MKVILIDDEKSMLLIMKKMLSKISGIVLEGYFQNTRDAYSYLKKNKVDMAFVDISMPDENGLSFVKRITEEYEDILITFLTCHKEYALEAFEVHAFDYIVKPITQTRLENVISRANKRLLGSTPKKANMEKIFLSIYCLGGFDVRDSYDKTVFFSSSKSAELIAYLAMKKGRFVSKWSIMEDIFQGMPRHNAETYLNTTVYKLRKALEPYGMKSAIISANESYRIYMTNIYVDYLDFERNVNSYFSFNKENIEMALKVEKLFVGELFADKDYIWSVYDKQRFFEIYWSFGKRLVNYLVEIRQFTVVLNLLKKMMYIYDLDEEINSQLMKVYAILGDVVALKAHYKKYREVLWSELGIFPDKEMDKQYTALLESLRK